MTRQVLLVAGLLALAATSTQGKSGVFKTAGVIGSVHHIGGIVQGERIVVNIEAV